MKAGPERDLLARYGERAKVMARQVGLGDIAFREIEESRARNPEERKREEASALRRGLPQGARLMVLDERGKSLASEVFAGRIAALRDSGSSALVIAIGGPDGLAEEFRLEAQEVIAYGAATFPHQIVRILAAEQIYRAMTILAGHPYHRA